MTELRRRMNDDMQVRGLADRTRETYLWAVSGLATFYRRSPDQISDQEIQAYLLHLIRDRAIVEHVQHRGAGVALLVPHHAEAGPDDLRGALAAAARHVARHPQPGRSRARDRASGQSETSHDDPDSLRGRPAAVRGAAPAHQRHRFGAADDPRRARQGRPGSVHGALHALARRVARILDDHAPPAVAVSVGARPAPDGPVRAATRLSDRQAAGGDHQARGDSRLAARLRDPPPGGRGRPPYDPTLARARAH